MTSTSEMATLHPFQPRRRRYALPIVIWLAGVAGLLVLIPSAMWNELSEDTPFEFGEFADPELSVTRVAVGAAVAVGMPLAAALLLAAPSGGGRRARVVATVATGLVYAVGNIAVYAALESSCHGYGSGAFPNPQLALAIVLVVSSTIYAVAVSRSLRGGRVRCWLWPAGALVGVVAGVVLSAVVVGSNYCDWNI
jgi:hypothetical protein